MTHQAKDFLFGAILFVVGHALLFGAAAVAFGREGTISFARFILWFWLFSGGLFFVALALAGLKEWLSR